MTDNAPSPAGTPGPHRSARHPAAATAGYSVDPNEAAKAVTAAALGAIPEAGEVLGLLVEIFWPTGTSSNEVWDSIESRVEALVDEKIDTTVYKQTTDDLTGLGNVLKDYADRAKPGHSAEVTSQFWTSASQEFAQRMPSFETKGFEILKLPLWVQAANMHLSLLRDGVLHGPSWGWNDNDVDSVVADLQKAISEYTAWAPRIFGWGLVNQISAGGVNYHACQPFRASNDFHQQMVPAVLDVAQRWPLFDPTAYPAPVAPDQIYLTGEIYSTPWGTADNSGLFVLPWQHPTQPPTQITVWAEPNLIDAIQVSYPDGAGPDGVSQTVRMGSTTKGSPATIKISPANPITTVDVWGGDVPQGLQFTFKDGTTTAHFGSSAGSHGTFDFYDHDAKSGRILSSIYVNGLSNYYGCADAIVFGFRYEPAQPTGG
jgi:hypothetical protein